MISAYLWWKTKMMSEGCVNEWKYRSRIYCLHSIVICKKMTDNEKDSYREKSALSIFKTKSELETFGILTEILFVVETIIALTLTKVLAITIIQKIITMMN